MLKLLIVSVLFLSIRGEGSHFSYPAQRIMATGCPSSSDFQYPNGSCFSTCPDPYKNETVSGSAFCYYPCSDKFFDSAKNTCVDSCHPFYIREENGIRYCDASTRCPLVGSFWNPSRLCTPACPRPFVTEDLGDGTYSCKNPCSGQYYDLVHEICVESCEAQYVRAEENIIYCDLRADGPARCPKVYEYKYDNGSCLPSCFEPYSLVYSDEFYFQCKLPCEQGQYFDYLQWICLDSCPPEYIRLEDNVLYCDPLVACSSVYDYKYPNGSCLDSCPSPGIYFWFENGHYFCDVPCPKGQYHDEQYKCVDSCNGKIRTRGEILYCRGGSNPDSLNAAIEIYLRYDIALADFKSQNYLAKFLALLSTFLDDTDNSEINPLSAECRHIVEIVNCE